MVFKRGSLFAGLHIDSGIVHPSGYFGQLSSFLCLWQWVPQHFIAGLLGVLILCLYSDRMDYFPFVLWLVFIMTSSIFALIGAIGLLFYFLYLYIVAHKYEGMSNIVFKLIRKKAGELFVGIIFTIVMISFYARKIYSETLSINKSLLLENGLLYYINFILFEFFIVFLVMLLCKCRKLRIPALVWYSAVFILILLCFQLGKANDLVLRASIPALLILAFFCAQTICAALLNQSAISRIIIIIFFFFAIPHFVSEYVCGLRSKTSFIERRLMSIKQYAGTIK
ncbi:hypothetical protein ACFL0T_08230 [Candidatus Omnitrophota bacterium]